MSNKNSEKEHYFSTLGGRICFIREKSGLNKRTFAFRIGVSSGAITEIEKNKRKPNKSTIILIGELFDCSPSWLLTGSPPAESTKETAPAPEASQKDELFNAMSETIHLQRELLAAHKSINEKENTVSNLEARLQKLEESSKELEKLREENTSLKKEIAAQEVSEEGKSQLAS